jgi:hypothetical protein
LGGQNSELWLQGFNLGVVSYGGEANAFF